MKRSNPEDWNEVLNNSIEWYEHNILDRSADTITTADFIKDMSGDMMVGFYVVTDTETIIGRVEMLIESQLICTFYSPESVQDSSNNEKLWSFSFKQVLANLDCFPRLLLPFTKITFRVHGDESMIVKSMVMDEAVIDQQLYNQLTQIDLFTLALKDDAAERPNSYLSIRRLAIYLCWNEFRDATDVPMLTSLRIK